MYCLRAFRVEVFGVDVGVFLSLQTLAEPQSCTTMGVPFFGLPLRGFYSMWGYKRGTPMWGDTPQQTS